MQVNKVGSSERHFENLYLHRGQVINAQFGRLIPPTQLAV